MSMTSSPSFVVYPHVKYGYRESSRVWDAVVSLFTLHNQTLNIWTHLLGFWYFASWTPTILRQLLEDHATWADIAFFAVFVLCAQFQMLSSAVYHLLAYVSEEWDRFFLRMDVAGIILMIFGSFAIGLHNGFSMMPMLKTSYLAIVCTPLLAAAALTLSPAVQSPRVVAVRNTLMAATTAFGVVPAAHWMLSDVSGCRGDIILGVCGMFGFYGVGFVFFLTRFPEAFFSHIIIDYVGQSHSWWHVCVWLAGASWLHGMMAFYECRHKAMCPAEL